MDWHRLARIDMDWHGLAWIGTDWHGLARIVQDRLPRVVSGLASDWLWIGS